VIGGDARRLEATAWFTADLHLGRRTSSTNTALSSAVRV
jgi:hypothetical protein